MSWMTEKKEKWLEDKFAGFWCWQGWNKLNSLGQARREWDSRRKDQEQDQEPSATE